MLRDFPSSHNRGAVRDAIAYLGVWLCCVCPLASAGNRAETTYIATAYSTANEAADCGVTGQGIVSADPRILPLGSRIRIHGAGQYSGEYLVADTGPRVEGTGINVFIPNAAEAKRFGKRLVRVEIVELSTSASR